MENKINSEVEKNGSDESIIGKNNSIDKGTQSGKKQRGIIARFFDWIARGTEEATKDGSFCTR